MLDRRRFLVIGAGLGGAVMVPRALGAGAQAATGPAAAAAVVPFSRPMPLPPTLAPLATVAGTDIYRLDLRPTTVEILPGLATEVLTYARDFLGGPVIRARRGRPVKLLVRNQVTVPANVHLHGGHVPAGSDGHPMDLIEPGSARLYHYPNRQAGATLWYHDHSHHTEAENVYRGMHGLYLVEDAAERRYRLPRGRYDVPIMLRDVQVDDAGALVVAGPPANRLTVLANGVPQPYFPVAARRYRFRLLNCSTTRLFQLDLGGATLTQVGTDGGLLPAPVPRTRLTMGAGERVEVVVDFAGYPVGTQLLLSDPVVGPVLRFDVTRTAAEDSALPAAFRPLPALPPSTVDRDVVFSFDFSTRPQTGLINGRPYDPERVDFTITRGSTETWRVTNADAAFPHTIHLHLVQFRVLSRDGGPPNADDAGRKDTVQLRPGETVTLQATFADHLGRYAFHCHMLEHSRVGMMAQMEIVP